MSHKTRLFTFSYKETAKAQMTPVQTVQCEGVEFSDKSVILRTPDKQCYEYSRLEAMFSDFSKHGKGKIRFHAGGDSKP